MSEEKKLVKSDASQVKKEVRTRQRASTSCTECRRRKQKCNQAKDRPCNNCMRRFPPVPCVYEVLINKTTKYRGNIVDIQVNIPDLEESDESNPASGSIQESGTNPPSATHLQFLSRTSSRSSWPSIQDVRASVSPTTSTSDNATSCDISPAIRVGRFYIYPEDSQIQHPDNSVVPAGGVALDPLSYLPIEASKRNAELFHFFVRRLAPYMCSIDGSKPPLTFNDKWLPFMTHSPIAAYVTVLSASYFQASTRGIPVEKSVDAIATKVKLIALINQHIAAHPNGVNDDSLGAVVSFAYNELIYSDERSTLAHMRGLRDMVRTRGGIRNIGFDALRKMLLRTDYQIACAYESDLFLDDKDSENTPVLTSYPAHLDSPLLESSTSFIDLASELNISLAAARVLDDMRTITTSVLFLSSQPEAADNQLNFMSLAHTIHSRLTSCTPSTEPSVTNDFIYQTLHTVASIYIAALLTRTPLSLSCTSQYLQTLWSTLWRIPLPIWKRIPGIFLFILLVANPYSRDKPEGRFLNGLIPPSMMAIGIEDWDVLIAALRNFVRVQRWLGGEVRDVVKRGNQAQFTPKGGLPAWSMSE